LYADDANLLGVNMDKIKKNTETVIDAGKLVGLEVNAEKAKYTSLSLHQSAGENYNIIMANGSSENVAQFKYLGTTLTNQNLIQEQIKWKLIAGNACCHSVQNLLSSRLLRIGTSGGL
jgi:hypothetical protein